MLDRLLSWRFWLALIWTALFPLSLIYVLLTYAGLSDFTDFTTQSNALGLDPMSLFMVLLPLSLIAGAVDGFRNSVSSYWVLLPFIWFLILGVMFLFAL